MTTNGFAAVSTGEKGVGARVGLDLIGLVSVISCRFSTSLRSRLGKVGL